MTAPTAFGRRLPRNDWEGDDFTPGAHGSYVTCCDTSTGRMAAWATNGRVDVDGRVIRAHVSPPDASGITMAQAAQGLYAATGLTMHVVTMTLAERMAWLRAGRGLVVPGRYDAVPVAHRFQVAADFTHSMFYGFVGHDGRAFRVWDPLCPDRSGYGQVLTLAEGGPFLHSLPAWPVGYVALQPLRTKP